MKGCGETRPKYQLVVTFTGVMSDAGWFSGSFPALRATTRRGPEALGICGHVVRRLGCRTSFFGDSDYCYSSPMRPSIRRLSGGTRLMNRRTIRDSIARRRLSTIA